MQPIKRMFLTISTVPSVYTIGFHGSTKVNISAKQEFCQLFIAHRSDFLSIGHTFLAIFGIKISFFSVAAAGTLLTFFGSIANTNKIMF